MDAQFSCFSDFSMLAILPLIIRKVTIQLVLNKKKNERHSGKTIAL